MKQEKVCVCVCVKNLKCAYDMKCIDIVIASSIEATEKSLIESVQGCFYIYI